MLKTTFISLFLALALVIFPGFANAQAVQDGTGQAPDSGVAAPGTTDTATDNGVNWLWLLPLLAVPLLFLVKRDETDEDNDIRYSDAGQFAGVKGGKAERKREEADEEDND